jgi:beta-N-acetylhexosaminidase
MYESSITVVRDDGTLPLSRDDSFRTLVAGVTAVSSGSGDTANYGPLLGDLVREASRGDVAVWTAPHEDPSDRDIREAAALAGEVDRILVFTFAQGALPAGQIRLVDALARSGPPLVTVSLGTPYDPAWLPAARTAVATYALAFTRRPLVCPDVVRCAVDALFGAPAPGSVPVRLPNSRE